jgi:nicotinate-nucleotide adenylyltransferase
VRIGLFGGSFNPPHFGHLALAQHAKDAFDLDQVWLLVTPQNPEKKDAAAPFEHRCEMCKLLAEEFDWLKYSTLELESGAKDK